MNKTGQTAGLPQPKDHDPVDAVIKGGSPNEVTRYTLFRPARERLLRSAGRR